MRGGRREERGKSREEKGERREERAVSDQKLHRVKSWEQSYTNTA